MKTPDLEIKLQLKPVRIMRYMDEWDSSLEKVGIL